MIPIRYAVVLCMFIVGSRALAAEDEWERDMRAGEQAMIDGDYAAAEKQFSLAMEIAQTLDPLDARITATLYRLASAYHLQGKNEKAISLLRRALSTDELARGIDHPSVAVSASPS